MDRQLLVLKKMKFDNIKLYFLFLIVLSGCLYGQGTHKMNFCINKSTIILNKHKLSVLKRNISLLSNVSNMPKKLSSYCFIKKLNNGDLSLIKATDFPHGIPFYFINSKNNIYVINTYKANTKQEILIKIDSVFFNNPKISEKNFKDEVVKYFSGEYSKF